MMKNRNLYIALLLILTVTVFSQEIIYKNQNMILGTINPSFFGFADTSKAGVIYSSEGFSSASQSENKYGFVNHFFEDKDFSLALDVHMQDISSLGYSTSQANLHYIYKATLTNEWVFNPSVSVGFGNSSLDFNSLIFEDQINSLTGTINGVTMDPVNVDNKVNYLDIGAGVAFNNSKNMFFGFNLKHINNPETSFNSAASNKKDLFISLQTGFEYDLNPYSQSYILPEYSYLYLYNGFSKQGNKTRIDLYQQAILGNVGFGLNEHFNNYGNFSVSQFGTSLSVFIEEIEVGVNYSFELGSKKLAGLSFNTFEIYLTFDFNPFKKNKRGNNSRFFDM